ncbi:hypothetical protein [Kosmotoga pacifica]|nr:hypothetical protein [Kosmotoga pacifica]
MFASGGILLIFLKTSGNRKLFILFSIAIIISTFALEILQGFLKYRVYDRLDIFSNLTGLGTVLLGYYIFKTSKRFPSFALMILLTFYLTFSYTQLRGIFKEHFGALAHLFLDSLLYFCFTYLMFYIGIVHKIRAVFWAFAWQIVFFPLLMGYLPFTTEFSPLYIYFSYSGFLAAVVLFFFRFTKKSINDQSN